MPPTPMPPDAQPGENVESAGTALNVIDWLGAGTVGTASLPLLFLPVFIAPTFEKLFAESGAALPRMTQLVLETWFGPSFVLVSMICVVFAVAARGISIWWRRVALIFAFVVACAGCGITLIALYFPVFTLADSVTAR